MIDCEPGLLPCCAVRYMRSPAEHAATQADRPNRVRSSCCSDGSCRMFWPNPRLTYPAPAPHGKCPRASDSERSETGPPTPHLRRANVPPATRWPRRRRQRQADCPHSTAEADACSAAPTSSGPAPPRRDVPMIRAASSAPTQEACSRPARCSSSSAAPPWDMSDRRHRIVDKVDARRYYFKYAPTTVTRGRRVARRKPRGPEWPAGLV